MIWPDYHLEPWVFYGNSSIRPPGRLVVLGEPALPGCQDLMQRKRPMPYDFAEDNVGGIDVVYLEVERLWFLVKDYKRTVPLNWQCRQMDPLP